MNRGSNHRFGHAFLAPLPSMRPRFMNRGSVNTALSEMGIESTFNEAPIHESGKWPSDMDCASMRSSLQ